MINNQSVTLNGVVYRWHTPSDTDYPKGDWLQIPTLDLPDEQTCQELEAAFLEQCVPRMATELTSAKEAKYLAGIVREMGAAEDIIDAVLRRDSEALGIPDESVEDLGTNPETVEAPSPTSFGIGTTPLDDIVLRDELFAATRPEGSNDVMTAERITQLREFFNQFGLGESVALPKLIEIATTGSGPFDRRELTEFLNRTGHSATLITKDSTKLIVGRVDWDPVDLDILIRQNCGRDLEIYSQEMYLTQLLFKVDVFNLPSVIIERFRDRHPALTYIRDNWDGWENRRFMGAGDSQKYRGASPEVGYLAYLGYRVGQSGIPTSRRRPLLEKAITEEFPDVYDDGYRKQWGPPSSCDRWNKLIETLEYLCQAAGQRKDRAMAIKAWRADLDWLYGKYRSKSCGSDKRASS